MHPFSPDCDQGGKQDTGVVGSLPVPHSREVTGSDGLYPGPVRAFGLPWAATHF